MKERFNPKFGVEHCVCVIITVFASGWLTGSFPGWSAFFLGGELCEFYGIVTMFASGWPKTTGSDWQGF